MSKGKIIAQTHDELKIVTVSAHDKTEMLEVLITRVDKAASAFFIYQSEVDVLASALIKTKKLLPQP